MPDVYDEEDYADVILSDEEQVKVLKQVADSQFKRTNYAGAIQNYTLALDKAPDCKEILSNRSAAYYRQNSYGSALRDAEELVRKNPTWAKGYYRLSLALSRVHGREREAYEACLKGLELTPVPQELIQLEKQFDAYAALTAIERSRRLMNVMQNWCHGERGVVEAEKISNYCRHVQFTREIVKSVFPVFDVYYLTNNTAMVNLQLARRLLTLEKENRSLAEFVERTLPWLSTIVVENDYEKCTSISDLIRQSFIKSFVMKQREHFASLFDQEVERSRQGLSVDIELLTAAESLLASFDLTFPSFVPVREEYTVAFMSATLSGFACARPPRSVLPTVHTACDILFADGMKAELRNKIVALAVGLPDVISSPKKDDNALILIENYLRWKRWHTLIVAIVWSLMYERTPPTHESHLLMQQVSEGLRDAFTIGVLSAAHFSSSGAARSLAFQIQSDLMATASYDSQSMFNLFATFANSRRSGQVDSGTDAASDDPRRRTRRAGFDDTVTGTVTERHNVINSLVVMGFSRDMCELAAAMVGYDADRIIQYIYSNGDEAAVTGSTIGPHLPDRPRKRPSTPVSDTGADDGDDDDDDRGGNFSDPEETAGGGAVRPLPRLVTPPRSHVTSSDSSTMNESLVADCVAMGFGDSEVRAAIKRIGGRSADEIVAFLTGDY